MDFIGHALARAVEEGKKEENLRMEEELQKRMEVLCARQKEVNDQQLGALQQLMDERNEIHKEELCRQKEVSDKQLEELRKRMEEIEEHHRQELSALKEEYDKRLEELVRQKEESDRRLEDLRRQKEESDRRLEEELRCF
ncbi:MAG: hypothetical protein J3Q66DRAFT_342553 [Benniella sp.]|nr:MAG: hypothetical protein J3Q66DRAFT_342553 [Benniella sp.]